MSEIKNIFGVVLFADGTKTILELVTASVASKKSLSAANLRGANLSGKKLEALRTFAASLYPYEVWAILLEDGSRVVRMGCFWKTLEEWEAIGIRSSNISEFPDDGSEISETRAALFELAKAAVLRIEYTQKVSKK